MRYYYVNPARDAGAATISAPFTHLEDAIRGAKFVLGNGAEEAWIIDHEGNLILPADQLKLRLQTQDLSPTHSDPREEQI